MAIDTFAPKPKSEPEAGTSGWARETERGKREKRKGSNQMGTQLHHPEAARSCRAARDHSVRSGPGNRSSLTTILGVLVVACGAFLTIGVAAPVSAESPKKGSGLCPGDLTGDGAVGPMDLVALADAWGACPPGMVCAADLNDDGVVNTLDVLQLLELWGPCPQSSICGDPAAGSCCSVQETPGCENLSCCELICPADPFCCEVQWDHICAGAAVRLCPDPQASDCLDPPLPPSGCGQPGTGDCCGPTSSPNCEDRLCCEAVCAGDAFCCNAEWDAFCAGTGFDPDCTLGPGQCGAANTPECDCKGT